METSYSRYYFDVSAKGYGDEGWEDEASKKNYASACEAVSKQIGFPLSKKTIVTVHLTGTKPVEGQPNGTESAVEAAYRFCKDNGFSFGVRPDLRSRQPQVRIVFGDGAGSVGESEAKAIIAKAIGGIGFYALSDDMGCCTKAEKGLQHIEFSPIFIAATLADDGTADRLAEALASSGLGYRAPYAKGKRVVELRDFVESLWAKRGEIVEKAEKAISDGWVGAMSPAKLAKIGDAEIRHEAAVRLYSDRDALTFGEDYGGFSDDSAGFLAFESIVQEAEVRRPGNGGGPYSFGIVKHNPNRADAFSSYCLKDEERGENRYGSLTDAAIACAEEAFNINGYVGVVRKGKAIVGYVYAAPDAPGSAYHDAGSFDAFLSKYGIKLIH
jgi:hypothetical protein